jgi:phage terminase small subunit
MEPPIVLGMALTPKQQLFVEEYQVDLNATRAAIRSGYSAATAASQGQRLLRNVEISERIDTSIADRAERIGISADRVFEELATIGFANISDYLTFDENGVPALAIGNLSPAQMGAIRDVKIETGKNGRPRIRLKLGDKLAALIAMSKHLDRKPATTKR